MNGLLFPGQGSQSVGMGKKLYSKKGKETTFSLRLLPIGGYCAMVGDTSTSLEEDNEIMKDVDLSSIPPERTLNGVAKWKKIIILLSGVFMNFVLALVIVAMIYLSLGSVYNPPKPIIKDTTTAIIISMMTSNKTETNTNLTLVS